MAELVLDGSDVVLHLRAAEKAEGFHGDVRVPLAAVRTVRVVDSAWDGALRGWRAPGTGVPRVIAVGTRRGDFGKDFAAVHGTGPAVVIELEGAEYGRLVLTADDPDGMAAAVRHASGRP